MLVLRIKYSDFRAWLTTKKITLETKSKLSKLVPDGTVLWAVDTDLSQAVKIVAEPNGVVVGGQNASNQIILQKLGLSGNSIWQIQVSDGLLTSLLVNAGWRLCSRNQHPPLHQIQPRIKQYTPGHDQSRPHRPRLQLRHWCPRHLCNRR